MRIKEFPIKSFARLAAPVFVALLVCLFELPAAAQVGRFNAARKNDKFAIERLLRDQAPIPLRQTEEFDAFFNEYVFPYFLSPKYANRLPDLRSDLRRYFAIGKSGEPYDRLNQLTRDFVQQILHTSKDPVLRYNAVLILGDLNEFEAAGAKPAKPLPAALGELIKLLRDDRQADYIHVAAMIGALRHASISDTYPLAPEAVVELTKVALDMLKQTEVPPSRTPGGHAYIRQSAAELLGDLGNPGKNNEIVNAVMAAISDPRAPLSMRLGMVPVLGMFRYDDVAKIDFASTLSTIGNTAVEAAKFELARAEALSEKQQVQVDPDRRRISYIFRQLQRAIDGPPSRRGGIHAGASRSPAAAASQALRIQVSRILSDLDKAEYVDAYEFADTLAEFQAALPARAKAARVPAGESREADLSDGE